MSIKPNEAPKPRSKVNLEPMPNVEAKPQMKGTWWWGQQPELEIPHDTRQPGKLGCPELPPPEQLQSPQWGNLSAHLVERN